MHLRKLKMDNIEKIFDEIINDANEGIRYNGLNIKFHTLDKISLSGTYSDVPVLIIRNKKEIVNKLKTYVDIVLKEKKLSYNKYNIKKCMSLLWANACFEDFSNPTVFIDNFINYYLHDDFLSDDISYKNIVIKKKIEPIHKYSPYAFKTYINLDEGKYYMPSINYGISNDTCYIYSINPSFNKEKFKYIEDKYDVYRVSLSLFLNELYKYGIGKIKVISYIPMRGENKDILKNFINMESIYKNIIITNNPFECDEYMHISISEFEKNINELIDEE